MMLYQSFKMAMKAVLANKARTVLTMLGIIIGVMSLVILVSLVDSATSSVTDNLSVIGNNVLTVSITDDYSTPLTQADLDDMIESNSEIADVTQFSSSSATFRVDAESETVSITGIMSNYFDVKGVDVVSGREFLSIDIDNSSYVVIIDENTATALFDKVNVAGESISINGYSFTIVGIIENTDDTTMSALIPFTTLSRIGLSSTEITTFYVEPVNQEDSSSAETQLETYLTNRFCYDDEAYIIIDMTAMQDMVNEIVSTMMLLLGGIASISLIVGGIGIMNIMLVSVTERTKEIGIRKAIGAKSGSIMAQFLIEALVISLLGGFVGLILSFLCISIASALVTSMTFSVSGFVALIAIGFSVFVGVVFGSYPAHKAAKKTPIEALRYSI